MINLNFINKQKILLKNLKKKFLPKNLNKFFIKLVDILINPKINFNKWNILWKNKKNLNLDITNFFWESINILLKI